MAEHRAFDPRAFEARVVFGHQQRDLERGRTGWRSGQQQCGEGKQSHSTTTTVCGTRPIGTDFVAFAEATSTMVRSSDRPLTT